MHIAIHAGVPDQDPRANASPDSASRTPGFPSVGQVRPGKAKVERYQPTKNGSTMADVFFNVPGKAPRSYQ
jgi:hypothetical protein